MDQKLVFEIVTGALGTLIVIFPSPLIKLCAGLARFNYENYKSSLAEVKKGGPQSLNEKAALKHEKFFLKLIGKKNDLYGPQTPLQLWLTRLLGLLFLVLSLATFLNIVPFNQGR